MDLTEQIYLPCFRHWDAREVNRTVPLKIDGIHLWFADYDEIIEESVFAAYRELLTAAEKEQEGRFYFERDRRRYLVTRALQRTVLSRYVSVDPKALVFSTNTYGRPEIANEQAVDARLSFNISHTHSLIVIGVTKGRSIGVDVENVHTGKGMIDLAERYFAPREVAELAATPADCQQHRFFEYWTLKEAYIKARGMGLSLPLDRFGFHFPNGDAIEIAIASELNDDPARWHFWQIRSTPDYLIAICAERCGAQFPRLTAWRSIPMVSDERLAIEVLRSSV